jgi:phosphoglycerate dehydrogenase-like enzyme
MTKIVVWDSVGNLMIGVRFQKSHDKPLMSGDMRPNLKADDPAAVDVGYPNYEEILKDHEFELVDVFSLEELEDHIEDTDVLMVHKVRVPSKTLLRGKKLKIVQNLGNDYRSVPMDAAKQLGIPVTATPLINYQAVSEHNFGFILNYYKQFPHNRVNMSNKGYAERPWGRSITPTRLMIDNTLGLLGMGEIARHMARYAQAFEMPTIYWDIVRFPELEEKYNMTFVEWDEIFAQSNILSVQLALNDQTHKIVGDREIRLMKPDALFMNTARGKLVDQEALTSALQERRIGGAALDVFYDEPLAPDAPLHALHDDLSYNVTLTQHYAWQGNWTHIRDSQEIWFNVRRLLDGDPLLYRVDDWGD